MELSLRKRAILAAVVRAYIESGEPVGSKILTELMLNAPSSATLRNEMNELCSMGFLSQPHTSAGRIPTSMGLKLYVDSIMIPFDLPQSTKSYILSSLAPLSARQQNLPANAADALSSLTGFCAFAYYKVDKNVYAKDIEVLPLSSKSAVLLFVTSDGRASSRICNFKCTVTDELRQKINEIINTKLKRKPLSVFTKANLQNVVTATCSCSFEIAPLICEIFDMANVSLKSQFDLSGGMKLYNICRPDEVRRILDFADETDGFIEILEKHGNKKQVIFGNETGIPELNGKAIVLCDYETGGKPCGKVGIIGPNRMFYEQIIPSIKYTADALGESLEKARKDMED